MSWNSIVASLKRHLSEYEKGVDFDEETKLLHMAHVAWNAMAIVSFYYHFPQGDDRLYHKLPKKRVGLDIDQVICDWTNPWCEKYGKCVPSTFYFHKGLQEEFDRLKKTGELQKFYLELPAMVDPHTLHFEPEVYITHRPVDNDVTEQWLDKHGFPIKPIILVKSREDKVLAAKEFKLDIFVDDNIDTFRMMNAKGIACYLMDAAHNKKYDVGYRRIKSLSDLPV
jgi:uncharacterized HAD superfamily protein